MRLIALAFAAIALSQASSAQVAGLRVPDSVVAYRAFSVGTSGSGKASLYLIGPSHSSAQEVELGQEVHFLGDSVARAGRYLVVVCSATCRSESFFVTPAKIASLSLLAHPSRVPVRADNAISAVAFAFDEGENLILTPVAVDFKLTDGGKYLGSRSVATKNGVAWFRTNSGSAAEPVQLAASSGNIVVGRIVRQVAADACNLRVKATRTASGVSLETEPVRDCSGNLVSDGTIVTFTKTDASRQSTVDAPVKQGVARAQMTSLRGVISVASGVVLGNSVRVGE